MTYPGKLVLIVGVSGTGKGALLRRAKETFPDIVFPISCTTRAIRPGETEGENYHFVTNNEFDAHSAQDDFLEWAPYGGNRYGTLKSEILPGLEASKLVVREVEVQGARLIAATIPAENLAIIYIHAGSWESLSRRIRGRAPISDEELEARRKRYEDELSFKNEATYVVENPDGHFEDAAERFITILRTLRP